MTDEEKSTFTPDEAAAADGVEEETLGADESRKGESEIFELKRKMKDLETELAEKTEQCLRIAAEYDNFRKRSAKERESIYTDAFGEALTSVFPVLDNLERAAQYTDGENVAKGVELTLKSLKESLEKLGVSEIEAEGATFDPELHNAVMHIEDEAYGENTVVEVLQKGYRRGDRVLRYAMVKVAN